MKINQLVSFCTLLGVTWYESSNLSASAIYHHKNQHFTVLVFLFDTLLTHSTCLAYLFRSWIAHRESIDYKFW